MCGLPSWFQAGRGPRVLVSQHETLAGCSRRREKGPQYSESVNEGAMIGERRSRAPARSGDSDTSGYRTTHAPTEGVQFQQFISILVVYCYHFFLLLVLYYISQEPIQNGIPGMRGLLQKPAVRP